MVRQEPKPDTIFEPPVRSIKRRHTTQERIELHKDEVIADYYAMQVRDFLKRWGLDNKIWAKLKIEWEIAPKPRGPYRPRKKGNRSEEIQPRSAEYPRITPSAESLDYWRGYRQAVLDGAPRMKEGR